MIEVINPDKIIKDRLAASFGLDKYSLIIKQVNKVDVSKDLDFQRLFNGFYVVRRNQEWRTKYYALFEEMKHKPVEFTDIITLLYEHTGNIEASFSSKMLSTIHPEKPIWDKYVLNNLGFQLTGKTKQEQLQNAIAIYSDIEKWYANFISTDIANECLTVFNQALPDYDWISVHKKIDCFLWGTR